MSNAVENLLPAMLPWVSPDAVLPLARHFRRGNYSKGFTLVRQGEVFGHALLVETGALRLFFTQEDGREFNKNFFSEGHLVLPLTGRMATSPSLFGVAALERARVWLAPMAEFKGALAAMGLWHTVQRKLLAAMVNEKLRREHDLLALNGTERYNKFCLEHPSLSNRIPVAQLASYLGLTSVSLSRIRTACKQQAASASQRTA